MKSDNKKTKAELISELDELRARLETDESEHYRQMVVKLPQIVYEMDQKGRFTFTNDFALKAFGYTPKDVQEGLYVKQIMHPDSLPQALINVERVMKGHPSVGEEYLAIRKDGTPFPIKVYSQGIFEDDKPVGVRGVVFDITDVRQAEEALRQSETYYRALFENTGTAMVLFGEDSVIRSCNSQFETLSGYTADEINGKQKWSDFVDPEDLKRLADYHASRLQKDDKAPREYEFNFLARDGKPKRVHVITKVVPGTENRVCSLVDITDRQKAEEALRKSEERYELVVRGANDGIWDWDIHTDAVYYSPRYKEILGYTDDEFPNTASSWKDAVHPDDLEHTIAENMECIEGRVDQFQVEYRMRHKDGSYRWILGRGASAKDENGKVYRLAGTHSDITDRRETESRFMAIFEQAAVGITLASLDGVWLQVNPTMCEITGYTQDELIGKPIRDISHPANLEADMELMRRLREGEATQLHHEKRYIHKNGHEVWANLAVTVRRDTAGKPLYFQAVITDITERKLHERTSNALYAISKAISTTQDLQDLYETIHEILDEVIDATNFFIAVHDEEEDKLTFTYFEDEKDAYYDIRNVSDPETKSLTVHILRTGKPLFLSQADPITAEVERNIGVVGTPAAVWLGVPLIVQGKIIGAMAVQHYTNPHHYSDADVALMETVSEQVALAIERKSNEEALTLLNEDLESQVDERTSELRDKAMELEAANKRLMELDEIKSSLVSSISHELRTPLTSIRGFAKLTGRDFAKYFQPLSDDRKRMKKGDRIRQNLEIIETEGERLTRLINDFLDINRIESGKAVWSDRFLNPCEVIKQAANAVAGSFAAKPGLELVVDLPETIPPIHADPDKVQQVLINLLNNACKFTNEGTVTITAVANKDTLTVTVADTGTGISPSELPYVFDKFHKSKLGDTISVKDKGTGLGLAICKEIVEHYDGSIWVKSVHGEGSDFSFTLPSVAGTETACN